MKLGALSFSIVLAAGVAGGVAFVGCSSSSDNGTTPADTVDSGSVVDTGTPKPDTNPPPAETGPLTCETTLDKSFACAEPTVPAGKTVCTDAMIDEFMNCFGTDADTKKCTAAQTKYAACNTCILKDWLTDTSVNIAACVKSIDPTGTCGKTVQCSNDCLAATCGDCDTSAGSGKTAATTEQQDCERAVQRKPGGTKPTGQCWDFGVKDYAACSGDPKFSVCFISAKADLLGFFRGACRDNANWSKADQPDGSEDAGVAETGTDSGSDTGSVTDSASGG
jgi:hypothetical protein